MAVLVRGAAFYVLFLFFFISLDKSSFGISSITLDASLKCCDCYSFPHQITFDETACNLKGDYFSSK